MIDKGEAEIQKLLRIYQDSIPEIRNYIYSRIIEIESETACGLLIVTDIKF